jgi:hypothetical protein
MKKTYCSLLAVTFDEIGFSSLSTLTPAERIFIYYLSRAAIVGYRIALFQFCPFPRVIEILGEIARKNTPKEEGDLFDQLRDWWVYLFCNYGVHCRRLSKNNKRIPSDMGLEKITPESLRSLGVDFTEDELKYLFDISYFPTATLPGDIEHSGVAFFPLGYKQEWYQNLTQDEKNCNVAYHTSEGLKTYSTHGICKDEMTEMVKWLKEAQSWSAIHSNNFSSEVSESLGLLIQHFETGDENFFREHSKVWLRMKNRVEYCFGFIEYYDDPMSHIGTFQADVTVKTQDISSLLVKLPTFEERFPFPQEYKRKDMSILPNAAQASKIIGIGGLGPVFGIIAYCLPNYSDIRSECGSKQVMYPTPAPTDIERYLLIYCSQEQRDILLKYSPDLTLAHKVGSLSTTLHETIGHASGNSIEGVTEKIRNERLGKWGNGLEEMRAEVLALYTTLRFYDEIVETGFLGEWPSKVPKEVICKLAIDSVAGGGWRRWRGLPSGSTTLSQAHALADNGIMYYLIDHCPDHVALVQETVVIPDVGSIPVLRLKIGDVSQVAPVVEKLAGLIQHFSSTANADEVNEFMMKYAVSTRDPAYADIVSQMQYHQYRGVLETANMFPEYKVMSGEDGSIIDVEPVRPSDPYQYFMNVFEMSRP